MDTMRPVALLCAPSLCLKKWNIPSVLLMTVVVTVHGCNSPFLASEPCRTLYVCQWKMGVAIKCFELMKPCCQPSNVNLQDLMSEITDDYVG